MFPLMGIWASNGPYLPARPGIFEVTLEATWRSGYAAACKAVNAGSIPAVASISLEN